MTTNRPIIQSSLLFRRRLANNIFIHNRFPKYHFNNLSNSINEKPPKSKNLFRYVAGSVAVSGIASSVYYFFYKEKLPINNNSDNQQHKIILSPSEATLKLREKQTSFLLHRNNGVYRYDTNQLASNCPVEDANIEEIDLGAKNGDRLFFGVFDGHSGWNTSRLLSKKLVPVIKEQLNKAYDGYGEYAK
ncbi:8463_t:CDS:1, partial [Acaulospora morrowiae]